MPETEITTLADALPAPNSPEVQNQPAPTADADAGDPEPQEQKAKGVQRRIDELTKNWREAERREQHHLDTIKALTSKSQPEVKEAAKVDPEAPVKPKLSDYNDWDQYEAAKDAYYEQVADYKAKKAVEGIETKARQKEQQSEQQKEVSEWNSKQEKARASYSDFDDVTNNPDIPISQAMARVIVKSDFGPDLAYFLGKHPEEAKRIVSLSDGLLQAREIGKIEARIAQEKSAGADTEAPAVTRAPKPPTPINKTTSTDNTLRDDLSQKEWLRRREAQLRSK